jgi:hypothetical protein
MGAYSEYLADARQDHSPCILNSHAVNAFGPGAAAESTVNGAGFRLSLGLLSAFGAPMCGGD